MVCGVVRQFQKRGIVEIVDGVRDSGGGGKEVLCGGDMVGVDEAVIACPESGGRGEGCEIEKLLVVLGMREKSGCPRKCGAEGQSEEVMHLMTRGGDAMDRAVARSMG